MLPFPLPEAHCMAEHDLRGYELGLEGNLKFVNCLHYLQEASELSADRLGIGVRYCRQRGHLWVLSRYHIRLDRYPFLGDRVRVFSWPVGWQRLFALRDFVFAAPEGPPFGCATSAWLLIDAQGHRPLRPQDQLPDIPLYPHRALENPFTALPQLHQVDFSESFRVRMHDLDLNRHVNNAVYVEWALEALPSSIWSAARPYEVEAQFSSMAFQGEVVQVEIQQLEAFSFLHRIFRPTDGRELTRLRSRWQPLHAKDDA